MIFMCSLLGYSCSTEEDITGYIKLEKTNDKCLFKITLINKSSKYYFLEPISDLWGGLKVNTNNGSLDGEDWLYSEMLYEIDNPCTKMEIDKLKLFNCNNQQLKYNMDNNLILIKPNSSTTITLISHSLTINMDSSNSPITWDYKPSSDEYINRYCGLFRTNAYKEYERYNQRFKIQYQK